MGLANKLNSGRKDTMPSDIDTKELTYIKAAELAKSNPPYPMPVKGFFINNKGDFGPSLTVVVEIKGEYIGINTPARYVKMFDELTAEEIDDILNGGLQITNIRAGVKTKNGITSYIDFEDVEPDVPEDMSF